MSRQRHPSAHSLPTKEVSRSREASDSSANGGNFVIRILASVAVAALAATSAPTAIAASVAPAAPRTTVVSAKFPNSALSRANALASAKSYLGYAAFSRIGLIKQLKFEGYSTADATWAVDATRTNWNRQAARAAKAYLDYSSFSRSGLLQQLMYEGYTRAQATYGVKAVGY